MKRFFAVLIFAAFAAALSGCGQKTDYFDYVSELRSDIFIYSDDQTEIKIQCVAREQPFNADGFCGNMCSLAEVYITFLHNPASVEVYVEGDGGEAAYEAVKDRFFISFAHEAFEGDGVDVRLISDGEEKSVRALSVKDGGLLTPQAILNCAREHDAALFDGLTAGGDFKAEIFLRLLYDDGCYYYVGVCDRQKNITAYLLDGGKGKVIATKKLSA